MITSPCIDRRTPQSDDRGVLRFTVEPHTYPISTDIHMKLK